ncbi:MAG: NifB/NifX family molybdenum-iron cluster-binding protein [Conexivisphaera sp.]
MTEPREPRKHPEALRVPRGPSDGRAARGGGLRPRLGGRPALRQGRYFAFVELSDGRVRSVTVRANPHQEHDSGDLPRFVRENGVNVIIAYGMDPRAVEFFNSFGIVVTGPPGGSWASWDPSSGDP